MVTVAVLGKIRQRSPHPLQLRDLGVELLDVFERQPLHVHAGAPAVVPQPQQRLDLLHREAQIPGPANEAQDMHVRIVVHPVSGTGTTGLRDKVVFLVVANHLGRDARHLGGLPDVEQAVSFRV